MPRGVYVRTEENKKNLSRSAKLRKRFPCSEETRRKISASHIGMKQSQETILKRTSKTKGRKRTLEQRVRISKSKKIKSNKYGVIHEWVSKWKGKPKKCKHCGEEKLKHRQYNWANIDHKYKRNLDDYIRLCCKCHAKYDKLNNLR